MILRALAILVLLAGSALGQTFSNLPLASLPLNGQDFVPLDQGSGCALHLAPCTTSKVTSLRLGQPLVQPTAPTTPFTYQNWWDTSTNPVQFKVYNGSTWVPIYQSDSVTGIPSFPGNIYLPSGNLGIGTTTVAPNWPITLFATNAPGLSKGITINSYDNSSGTVSGAYRGFSARGTLAAPTSILSGDTLIALAGSGYWSGKTLPYYAQGDGRAQISFVATENWSSPATNGTAITFITTPIGSNTTAEVARLDGNGLLGLGTTTPNFGVTLAKNNPIPSGGARQGFTSNTYENGSGLTGTGFRGFTARGTVGSPAQLVTNDQLATFAASGFWSGKTNAFFTNGDERAEIGVFAAENWGGASNNGTYLKFSVTANGAGVQTERVRLNASGGFGIGTTTDPGANNLIVSGNMQLGLSTALTLAAGELGFGKITASGSAPGAAGGKIELVCGTGAGTAKLIAYAGTSNTPTTILDNIGAAVTGC